MAFFFMKSRLAFFINFNCLQLRVCLSKFLLIITIICLEYWLSLDVKDLVSTQRDCFLFQWIFFKLFSQSSCTYTYDLQGSTDHWLRNTALKHMFYSILMLLTPSSKHVSSIFTWFPCGSCTLVPWAPLAAPSQCTTIHAAEQKWQQQSRQ